MSAFDQDLPSLDCHAHIGPDVTPGEVDALDGAIVFAVTRSLAEAVYALKRGDPRLVWGCGVHPGDANALDAFEPDRFGEIVQSFALVGEIGLHRGRGDLVRQRVVLMEILNAIAAQPVIVSIHSAAAVSEVLDMLERQSHPGTVLHWFLGDGGAIARAAKLGYYFSVSAAIPDDRLALYPQDRVLPETDFPSGGPESGRRPGDTASLEGRLARIWQVNEVEVRHRLFRNLRTIASESGAVERFPERLQDFLLMA